MVGKRVASKIILLAFLLNSAAFAGVGECYRYVLNAVFSTPHRIWLSLQASSAQRAVEKRELEGLQARVLGIWRDHGVAYNRKDKQHRWALNQAVADVQKMEAAGWTLSENFYIERSRDFPPEARDYFREQFEITGRATLLTLGIGGLVYTRDPSYINEFVFLRAHRGSGRQLGGMFFSYVTDINFEEVKADPQGYVKSHLSRFHHQMMRYGNPLLTGKYDPRIDSPEGHLFFVQGRDVIPRAYAINFNMVMGEMQVHGDRELDTVGAGVHWINHPDNNIEWIP